MARTAADRAVLTSRRALSGRAAQRATDGDPGVLASLVQLQRTAGNAATVSVLRPLTGVVPVQRRLAMTGTGADVATTLNLLTKASGLQLRRGRKAMVSVDGTPGRARSPSLAGQLTSIIDDDKRTAMVHVGPATEQQQEIGAFPDDAKKPIQHVFIDQVLTLEKAVPGAGAAKLAHEITENFVAQPLIAAGGLGDFSFDPSHAAAVKVEDKVLAELQAEAGGPQSGRRMRDYIIDAPNDRGRGPRRFIRAETHENDFILYEAVPGAAVGARRITRDAGTTVRTRELVGFGRRDIGLPTGADKVLQEIADLLSADTTAAVILQPISLAWSTMDAPLWPQLVTEGIQQLMTTSDVVARYDGRFSHHPVTKSGDYNGVQITVRRPSTLAKP